MSRVYVKKLLVFWPGVDNLPRQLLRNPWETAEMNFSTTAARKPFAALLCAFVLLFGLSALAGSAEASTKNGILKGNPSNKVLASEFLLLLKAENKPGLRNFLDKAFLLQRGDGTYLNKKEYIADPSLVDDYKVRNIVGTRDGNVRVICFEANNIQIINGQDAPGGWVPRLSTFVKKDGRWTLISHANFLAPPADV